MSDPAGTRYRSMLPEPVPPHATALVNADGHLAGFEWSPLPAADADAPYRSEITADAPIRCWFPEDEIP